MTPMPQPYWTNRLCGPEDIAAAVELVRLVHGDEYPEINRTFYDWRYLSDTAFHGDILMADFEGRPIGIQPVSILDFQWNEARLRGAVYTGVLTHPAHRRRGIFQSLVSAANEHARRRGCQFSFTLPNERSLPGFLKTGEWHEPGLIPLHVKILDGRALLRPRVGRISAHLVGWLPHPLFTRQRTFPTSRPLDIEPARLMPPELDRVFDEFSRDCGSLMVRRTADYWNWRYAAKPNAAYHLFIARRNGQVVGAVATSLEKRMGIEIGMVLDLIARGGIPVLCRLLRTAEEDLASRGLGLAACEATSPMLQAALRAEGYVGPRPTWLPKKFHFVYRPTGVAGLSRIPSRVRDWHLTLGDSDTV
jgi:GNAT superfamily N-acetyltransferase